jgi:hypothetical protein
MNWKLAIQVDNAFTEFQEFTGDLEQALNAVKALPCPSGGCRVVTADRAMLSLADYTKHCSGPDRETLPLALLHPEIRRSIITTDKLTGDEVIFNRKRHWFKGISEDRHRRHENVSDYGEGDGSGRVKRNKPVDHYLKDYGNEMASCLLGEVEE